ncbi:MAG: radical SAM protein [Thermoplasmata archaeon]|nr:radical SAM protein [Thermoplasmata archaeon]
MNLTSVIKSKSIAEGGIKGEPDGFPIVLTASKSEISAFSGDPFGAFIATFPKKIIPRHILNENWFLPDNEPNGRARFMPYGLRKVESILMDEFGADNVIAVHPDSLDRFVGPKTKVVGISSMDPMGSAYVSFTYNSLLAIGGASVDELEFYNLVNHPALRRHHPAIVVGGAGAWQVRDARKIEEFNVDCLVHGLAEQHVAEVFRKAMNGEKLPREVYAKAVPVDSIRPIKRASSYGVVEITRGCGRGCHFCSPTNRSRHSLPLDLIMKEVEVNVKGGSDSIFTATEDMFLYKCGPKFTPNREAVVKLYKSIAAHPGVEFIHLSHISLAPVVQDPKLLEEVTPYLLEKTRYTPAFRKGYKKPFVTALFGIESGSIRIMDKYMKGKALPFKVEDWHDVVVRAAGMYNDNDWRPMGTIITGWPGETQDDTLETLELLDKMKDIDMFYVPLLFIPLEDSLMRNERSIDLDYLNDEQWEFISKCWRYNIKNWDKRWQPFYSFAALFSYIFYFRWKHGRKVLKPILSIAGLDSFVQRKSMKSCEEELCQEAQ